MGVVDMSSNPPPHDQTKELFPSPALSLSLAGIFRGGGGGGGAEGGGGTTTGGNKVTEEVEEGEEGSGGGGGGIGFGRRDETTVEISSENSGPLRSRSEDDFEGGEADHPDDDDDIDHDDNNHHQTNRKKKRKKYHRHTAQQIREMEADGYRGERYKNCFKVKVPKRALSALIMCPRLFKESPHPDENQRQQLSKQLGLHPRQVKFWFQNRRTQIKAIQERHENALLKTELERFRDENKTLRETIQKASCPNCGFATSTKDASEEQQLRIENARLKSEVEKLRAAVGKYTAGGGTSPNNNTSSCSVAGNNDPENSRSSCFDLYTAAGPAGMFGLDKSVAMEIVNRALEELKKMATAGEPLWIRSLETGREILNYDEYLKEFPVENYYGRLRRRPVEASRDSGIVFLDLPRLVQSFTDVNQWKEMFPCMISKAAIVDTICTGEATNKDGLVQLMFAELQMLTPMVPTREVYFVRYSKQLSADWWAIVDVSIDKVENTIDGSLNKCRKLASGCIIEDKSNGHCKVTWVEHLECQRVTVHSLYRTIVNSGLAFGARHWMSTLQLQCERLVFFMATNVPTKDSTGVATIAGRKSLLQLAQRMTVSFCRAVGASSHNTWSKVTSKTGDDIRVASRKNLNDPGEPLGVILCAVSSVWLPVSHNLLFDFLRDENRRNEWDIMSNRGPIQSIANLAKGQDRGNAVSIHAMQQKENSMWVLQDTCTNGFESMIVYAPVEINGIQSVITGCDSSNIAVLPSGFSILPDGIESRNLVITSRPEEEKSAEGGSLLTIAFQILTSNSPTSKLSVESVESINSLISCTLHKIKESLNCEDG